MENSSDDILTDKNSCDTARVGCSLCSAHTTLKGFSSVPFNLASVSGAGECIDTYYYFHNYFSYKKLKKKKFLAVMQEVRA